MGRFLQKGKPKLSSCILVQIHSKLALTTEQPDTCNYSPSNQLHEKADLLYSAGHRFGHGK